MPISRRFRLLSRLEVALLSVVDRRFKDFQRATLEIGALNDTLVEHARLKDHFIAKVAHDLRTPLTSIVGYTELLVDGSVGELEPEQRQFLQVVDRNARRLERMVDELLLMAKIDAGTLSMESASIDLADLLIESVESARSLAEDKGVRIILHPLEAVIVNGDRKRLGQAIEKLLTNAINSSPTDGQVELRIDLTVSEALVTVTDSGNGLSPDEQSRLFDKFYLGTQGSGSGAGFGLSMVSHIAEAHQGSVKVSSELGVGSTITLALPRIDSQRLLAKTGTLHGE